MFFWFNSENVEKAEVAIKTFREESNANSISTIALGITPTDLKKPLTTNDNDFTFSDETDFDVSSFPYKWNGNFPDYNGPDTMKCVYLRTDGEMANIHCESLSGNALCFVEEDCKGANSDSERSRLNLPIFALFMAGSFFKIFFALAEPAF